MAESQHTEWKESWRDNFGKRSESVRKEFGKSVEKTYQLIVENQDLTAEQLAEQLGIVSRTVENHQAKLKKGGYIAKVGSKTDGHWEIIKE